MPDTPRQPASTRTRKVKDLTGPAITTAFGMEGTDLGILARTPGGRLLSVFEDTFAGAGVGAPHVGQPHPGSEQCAPTTTNRPSPGNPDWRSPVGLYSDTTDPPAGLERDDAAGHSPRAPAQHLI